MKSKCMKNRNWRLTVIMSSYIFLVLMLTMICLYLFMPILIHFDVTSHDNGLIPLASFAIIVLIVGTTIGAISSFIPLSPIKKLIEATNHLAQGNFDYRLKLEGPAEIKKLAQSFNAMALALAETKILNTDFVNNFSHEFKTPIISIQGFAKLLKDPTLTDAEKEEYLNIIIEETQRLTTLSTSILYLSKIENLDELHATQTFNITEQLRQTVLLFMNKIDTKNIEISLEGQDHIVEADEEMLKQIFVNIMDNALKFSYDNSEIDIVIKQINTKIKIDISNYGIPIDINKLERIYDKFYQADNSHGTVGNGLGLTLVKKIVSLHQGTINIIPNEDLTTVSIILPIKQ